MPPTGSSLADRSLAAMLAERDLILVTGKGGTGKSTLVAALAQVVARRRGRALAIEMTVHPRLPGLVPPGGPVEVLNLDLESATAAALGRLLGLPALVGLIAHNRIIRQFVRTSPAARETILLDELRGHVERLAAERVPVVVDLPASGHAVTFLDTPRSVQRMLRVGPIAHAAAQAEALLGDARRCEVVVIALPEELPVNETIELVRKARDIGVATHHVVVNQVPQPLVAPAERAYLDVIRQHGAGAVGRFAERAHDDSHGADLARAQIERLQAAVPVRIHEIPRYELADPRRCVEGMVRELARELGE